MTAASPSWVFFHHFCFFNPYSSLYSYFPLRLILFFRIYCNVVDIPSTMIDSAFILLSILYSHSNHHPQLPLAIHLPLSTKIETVPPKNDYCCLLGSIGPQSMISCDVCGWKDCVYGMLTVGWVYEEMLVC